MSYLKAVFPMTSFRITDKVTIFDDNGKVILLISPQKPIFGAY